MKPFLLFLLYISAACLSASQPTPPDWTNPTLRAERYPAGTYFTGFAAVSAGQYDSKETALTRLRQDARVEAIASIQVSVEQTIEHLLMNTHSNGNVSTAESMTLHSGIKTSIKDIPGLKVEVYENTKTGDLYAFAWVKAADLHRKLIRRIAVNVTKAENELLNAESCAQRGDKIQARNMAQSVSPLFDEIENDQFVVLSIQPATSDEELALQETQQLKKRFLTLTSELKNSLSLYIDCQADLIGKSYTTLKKVIQGQLSDLGVMFADTDKNTDYIISIVAETHTYNTTEYSSAKAYFVYVDAQVSIFRCADHKRIYENVFSEKGSHTFSYEQAARDAYQQLAPRLSQIIREQITQ